MNSIPTIETGLALTAVDFRGKYTQELCKISVWAAPQSLQKVKDQPRGIGGFLRRPGWGSGSL